MTKRSRLEGGHHEGVAKRLWGPGGAPNAERLTNGLELCVIEDRRLPIVATVLAYRVGTRDERAEEAGAAHFLEHMMFKGSAKFAAGEIDRVTEARGGANNAFTSHDVTAYYFSFARDFWTTALEIEIDRMGSLRLAPADVDSERQVIVEEIAMYESDPWDVLHQRSSALLYGAHPYGRPVLGTRESLAALGSAELGAFHASFYRANNAVLTIVGDVRADEARAWAERMPSGAWRERAQLPMTLDAPSERRVERDFGEVSRLLVTFPAPAGGTREHSVARLLATQLAGGRASRLNRVLVEEEQLAVWVSSDVSDTAGPSTLSFALEAAPGVEPDRLEARLFELLDAAREERTSAQDVDRARKLILSDWMFAHERVQRRAMTAALALSADDAQRPLRDLDAVACATSEEVSALARHLLDRSGAVVAWSYAERDAAREPGS